MSVAAAARACTTGAVSFSDVASAPAPSNSTADSGTLTAVGTVVKAGSRIGFAEANISDAAGKLVATATSTLLIF